MALAQRVSRRVYRTEQFPDPGFIKLLFGSPIMALLFLPLRLYIGWQWLSAGIEKINSPAWTQSGTALQGFWASATKAPAGAKGAARRAQRRAEASRRLGCYADERWLDAALTSCATDAGEAQP